MSGIKIPETVKIVGKSLKNFLEKIIAYYEKEAQQNNSEAKANLADVYLAIVISTLDKDWEYTIFDETFAELPQNSLEIVGFEDFDYDLDLNDGKIRQYLDFAFECFAKLDEERFLRIFTDNVPLINFEIEENFLWLQQKINWILKGEIVSRKNQGIILLAPLGNAIKRPNVTLLKYLNEVLADIHKDFENRQNCATICYERLLFLSYFFPIPKEAFSVEVKAIYKKAQNNAKEFLEFLIQQRLASVIVDSLLGILIYKIYDPYCVNDLKNELMRFYPKEMTRLITFVQFYIVNPKQVKLEKLFELYIEIFKVYNVISDAAGCRLWAKKALALMPDSNKVLQTLPYISICIRHIAKQFDTDLETFQILQWVSGLFMSAGVRPIIPMYVPLSKLGEVVSVNPLLELELARSSNFPDLQTINSNALMLATMSVSKQSVSLLGQTTPSKEWDDHIKLRDETFYFIKQYLGLAERLIQLNHATLSKTVNFELVQILANVSHLIIVIAPHLPKFGEKNQKVIVTPRQTKILQQQLVSLHQKISEYKQSDAEEVKGFGESWVNYETQKLLTDFFGKRPATNDLPERPSKQLKIEGDFSGKEIEEDSQSFGPSS